MRPRALVLRPAPGNARTCAALAAAGAEPVALPLFATGPVAWQVPDPQAFDALLLTSAAAVRHGGEGLAALRGLPVVAVGAATAAAARAAGLSVALVGQGDAASVVAQATTWPRLLHLAGRERVAQPGVAAITVYASEPLDVPAAALEVARDAVVLLHSARAAARFAQLSRHIPRDTIRLATLGASVAAAAGEGWKAVAIAATPDDEALVRVAIDR